MTDAPTAAPAADGDEEELENYLDLRPTGGMHVVSDGHKRRLRAPRMRDYRKLYELWRDEAEALEVMSEELQEFLTRTMAAGDEREARGERRVTEEEKAEDRRLGQKIRVATEDAALRWWAEAIATLGVTTTDQAADAEDLPVFLATADSVNMALNHWRSVPSRSGAR